MGLIEIDVVGLQALERALNGTPDLLAIEPHLAIADMVEAGPGTGCLRRQDDLVAVATGLQPGPDVGLGQALRFGPGRKGVHFRGVDEVDAVIERHIELRVGIGFRVLLAEGHGSEADVTDLDSGLAEFVHLHGIGPVILVKRRLSERRGVTGTEIGRPYIHIAGCSRFRHSRRNRPMGNHRKHC